ncbi:MAG: transglutaminase domain-containing protein [Oscillospiraceae bacterium]
MKKFISLFLSLVTVLGIVCCPIGEQLAISADAAVLNKPYYYSQLSEKEQGWYDKMKSAVLAQKKSVKLNAKINGDTLQKLATTMYYYDVQCFNISDFSAEIYSSYTVVYFKYRYSKDSCAQIMEYLEKQAETVLAKFDNDTKIYTKIKTIHDYIISRCSYDKSTTSADIAYGALGKKKAKCDGYSKAFAFLCSRAGIRTVNVIGVAGGENHMWNKVYYNKKWYNVDVTWDDPVSNDKENLSYAYFMASDSQFSSSHKADPCDYEIPAAEDSSKTYYKVYGHSAKDTAEAKSLLTSGIAKAANSNKLSYTIQFETKSAYDSAIKAFTAEKGKMLFDILSAAQNKTKTKIVTEGYTYSADDNALTFTMDIYYPNTKLSKYFTDISQVPNSQKDFLNKLGISA